MAFPTTSVLDNFNRADANPLDGSWSNGFYGDGNYKVLSNQLDKAVAGWTGARYTAAQYGADCEIYVDVVTVGTELQLYLRVGGTHTAPSGYYFKWYSGTNACAIVKATDGATAQIGSAFTCTLSNGDKLGFSAVGTTLTAYRYTSGAWSAVHSETDSTYTAAGYIAIEANGSFVCDNFGGGTISSSISGALSQTLGGLAISSAATLALAATLTKTLSAATLSSAGKLAIAGQSSKTLDNATLQAVGALALAGQLAKTLDDATLQAIANLALTATLDQTLAALTTSATARLAITGALTQTLDDVTLAATGINRVAGVVNQTLGNVTLNATGTLALVGVLGKTLDAATLQSIGRLALIGQLNQTLGSLTLYATNQVSNPVTPTQPKAHIVKQHYPREWLYDLPWEKQATVNDDEEVMILLGSQPWK